MSCRRGSRDARGKRTLSDSSPSSVSSAEGSSITVSVAFAKSAGLSLAIAASLRRLRPGLAESDEEGRDGDGGLAGRAGPVKR